MAIACACSAASIISSRMARSRRIERLRFGQHMVTHPTMNGSTGDEVYSPPKNFGQSLRKILDFPPQTHTRFQRKQEINVAIRAGVPTRHGAENFKARDPVAFTQFAQTFLVHDLDRHAQSLDAAQPIPASGSPSHRATPELRRRHPVAPRFAGLTGERLPYRQTPALQRKQTTARQASPGGDAGGRRLLRGEVGRDRLFVGLHRGLFDEGTGLVGEDLGAGVEDGLGHT